MNADFVNPFLESVIKVLTTMASIEAKPGKPSVKQDDVARGDVTGIIGMAGQQTKGSFAITFTETAIFKIAAQMVGDHPAEVDESVTDLVGEITNMATGGAKAIFEQKGYDFDMAIPAVVAGKDHRIVHKSTGPKLILPFATDAGEFFVEICFEH